MADLDALLRPVSDEDPTGPDLGYDPDRQAIEGAFDAAADGDDPVDWRDVVRRIEDQSGRTKDIWLAVYLARAGARSQRLDMVEIGCRYLAGLLDRYWDDVHPSLEEYGYEGRRGACEALVRIGEFIGPLRRTPLIEHPRLGSYTGEDVERFAREGDGAEGFGMFRAAVDDLPDGELAGAMARLASIREAIEAVDRTLAAHAGDDTGTNFAPTYAALDALRRALATFGGGEAVDGEAESGEAGAGGEAGASPAAGTSPGRVESRDDVRRALDAITDYYRRREPGSPVPVALDRARRWVDLDFLSLLRDIAPGSMDDARRVLTGDAEDENAD